MQLQLTATGKIDVTGDVEIMMGGQTCTVCTHEASEAIDRALVAGESNRVIASQYGISQAAVGRHSQNHLPATLVKAAEDRELAHGKSLRDQVQGLVEEALASMERSKAAGKEKDVLGGIREARHSLELTGRITGELQDNNRDGTPDTALDAIIKLAAALSEEQLRRMADGRGPVTVEVEGHVVEPE